jgi:hypothetical protein
MKKILCSTLLLLFIFSGISCGPKQPSVTPDPSPSPTQTALPAPSDYDGPAIDYLQLSVSDANGDYISLSAYNNGYNQR